MRKTAKSIVKCLSLSHLHTEWLYVQTPEVLQHLLSRPRRQGCIWCCGHAAALMLQPMLARSSGRATARCCSFCRPSLPLAASWILTQGRRQAGCGVTSNRSYVSCLSIYVPHILMLSLAVSRCKSTGRLAQLQVLMGMKAYITKIRQYAEEFTPKRHCHQTIPPKTSAPVHCIFFHGSRQLTKPA